MKKLYSLGLGIAMLLTAAIHAQIVTYTSAVSDITLQCSGGTSNRTGVAYNPCFNLYYSVNAGSASYPIETFSAGGGNALSSVNQGSDYRGLWWNSINNRLEGNTYSSGGVYSNTLSTVGWAQSTTSNVGGATMPNVQSAGHANVPGNIIYYYNSGTLYLYSKSSNTLISSATISGLPASTSNLNSYGIVYTGFPGGKDVAVYDYVNKAIYYINATTAAYSGSCALPTSAPAAASFQMGYANNRFFLYNSGSSQWIGYPLSNAAPQSVVTTSLSASNTLVCQGNPVTLSASGAVSYTWSSGSNATTAVVVPTANAIYSVTSTSSVGCIGISTIAVNIIPGAIVSAAASPTSICAGNSATISGGGGVNSYTWNTSSNAQNIVVNPSSTTSYTVQGTNSSNCVTTATITLVVNNNLPVLSVTSSTNQTCLGKTATLTASGAITYTWSNGVQNGVSFTPSVTNNYTVYGQNGCGTTSAVTSISVSPLPVTVLSSPSTVCAGNPATLTAVSAATGYTWQPYGLSNASVIVNPTATTVYTVSVSDGTCSGVASLTVAALPVPTVNSTSSSSMVCAGSNVTLTASGALNYTWTPSGLTGATVVITPTAAALYSVVGNNSLGCFGGSSQIVITNPSPTLTTNSTGNLICAGDQVTLTVSGASTYTWDNGSNSTSVVVNPNVSTQYTVSGTTNNCSTSQVLPITVFVPSISIAGPTAICSGGTATFTASGANIYNWNTGVTGANLIVSPNTSSNYTLTTITASSGINCSNTKTLQLTVLSLPSLTATANRTVMCKNENNTLTISGANSYTWSNAGTSNSIIITPTLVTTMNYSVIGMGSNGCQNTATLQVKVNSCVGIDEISNTGNTLLIFPNPSHGNLSLHSSTPMHLKLSDQLGRTIMTIDLNDSNGNSIQVDQLSAGIYYIIGNDQNMPISKKIIIEN